jgi:hypothetical protein
MEMLQWRGNNLNELIAFCGQRLHHHPHSLYALQVEDAGDLKLLVEGY